MSMSHPEHEDPAMRDHDDEAAEMAAIKLGFEAAESALADAADAVGSALVDLTAVDAGFELVPEMTQCVRVLAMVQARVAERLAYLATVPGVAAYAPEQPGRHRGAQEADRRLAGHPSAPQSYIEFPHPFEPAESTAPDGSFARVPAGEGSGLYLGAPRESLVPPPAAPLVERDMVRDFARSVLAEPLVDLETMRPLWAEGAVAQAVAPLRLENEVLRSNSDHLSSENASLVSRVESMAMRIESLAEELAKPEDVRLREALDALEGRAVIFDGLGARVGHLLDELDEWTGRAGEAERTVDAARRRLACVADDMTEHAYQELASALESPPRIAGKTAGFDQPGREYTAGDALGLRRDR